MKQGDNLLARITLVLSLVASACGGGRSEVERLEPDIVENYVYYNIGGTAADDLRRQMDLLGPSDESGSHHDAYTDWFVDWNYPNLVTNDGCATGMIRVTVTITQTFPRWEPPPETLPNLIQKWETYLEALQLHEDGHREIGVEAGEKILRVLSELPAYPTCGELEQAADEGGENVLDEYRRRAVNYDRTTKHGALQGARFP